MRKQSFVYDYRATELNFPRPWKNQSITIIYQQNDAGMINRFKMKTVTHFILTVLQLKS